MDGIEMKCEYCHKREADRVFTMACCSKGYDKVAHSDEHFCSKCYDNDETFELLETSAIHYPIENMDKECNNHEEDDDEF